MCESDPCHCDCHEWAQPRPVNLRAHVKQLTSEYNAMVANGLILKARPLKRRIETMEKLLDG